MLPLDRCRPALAAVAWDHAASCHGEDPETAFVLVGPVGLEPTTRGLKGSWKETTAPSTCGYTTPRSVHTLLGRT